MPLSIFTYSGKTFKSEDPQQKGEFQIFETLTDHMKMFIMEKMSIVELINLVDADPCLSHLAKAIMKRKRLHAVFLERHHEGRALRVVINSDDDTECVVFPYESQNPTGDVEMSRKAFSFMLRILNATKADQALVSIHKNPGFFPEQLHLLRLPSLGGEIKIKDLYIPVNGPVDFISQLTAGYTRYVPSETAADDYSEFDYLCDWYQSSHRI